MNDSRLSINVGDVAGVMLSDGWHELESGSFRLVSAQLQQGNEPPTLSEQSAEFRIKGKPGLIVAPRSSINALVLARPVS